METTWFALVAFMLAMYVILDGFDLGTGIIHFLAARNADERRILLRAIGPVWDGNEVWLLAAAGTLYFAFPLLYASSFSGFYLPLMIVLWLLMLRGLGIEFQHQVHNPLWKSFWHVVFSFASILLTIFFGAALGNVVRGVPLNADGYFFEPLWTTFTVVPEAGILDWFTVLMGLVAFFVLTNHGSNYIALKTVDPIRTRAHTLARASWWGILITSVAALIATSSIHPEIWSNYTTYPWGWIFPLTGLAGLLGMWHFNRRESDLIAFLSSGAFIAGMLGATAFGLYPRVLPASTDPAYSLTVFNTRAQEYGLQVGLVWWLIGMVFVAGYFYYVYRTFRGRITAVTDEAGY
ncbi:MAG: cytochrome d ubiquinol oxidase subunit II [Ignavibacteriales bacterium]|nr:cytochrome d ubiquinol oxidase subunit II [Ignavibacteriales bacterium]